MFTRPIPKPFPNKTSVLVAVGTRPEAIKLAPIIRRLRSEKDYFNSHVFSTGQHKELLSTIDVQFDTVLSLMVKGQSLNNLLSSVTAPTNEVLERVRPDIVIVQGDTTTAAGVGMAAFQKDIIVAHVEAGLRTYHLDSPFPEEFNRQLLGLVACLHFAPTNLTKQNLLAEGVDPEAIFTVGNSGIDSALHQAQVEHKVDNSVVEFFFQRSQTILLCFSLFIGVKTMCTSMMCYKLYFELLRCLRIL